MSAEIKRTTSLLDLPPPLLLKIFDFLAEPLEITTPRITTHDPPSHDEVQAFGTARRDGRALYRLGMTCRYLRNSIQDIYWPDRLTFTICWTIDHGTERERHYYVPLVQTSLGAAPLYRSVVPRDRQATLVRKLELDMSDLDSFYNTWSRLVYPTTKDNRPKWKKLKDKWSKNKAGKLIRRDFGSLEGVEELTLTMRNLSTLDFMSGGNHWLPCQIVSNRGKLVVSDLILQAIWEYLLENLPACRRVSTRRVPLEVKDDDEALMACISKVAPTWTGVNSDWHYRFASFSSCDFWPTRCVVLRELPRFLAACDMAMGAKINQMIDNKIAEAARKHETKESADTDRTRVRGIFKR